MPYYDLNALYSAESAAGLVEMAIKLGYDGIAFNHVVPANRKVVDSDLCSIPQIGFDQFANLLPQAILKSESKIFNQFSRITLIVDDTTQIAAINSNNPILKSYDIFAVEALTEKAFSNACLHLDGVDVISIDLGSRLPFQLKRTNVMGAIRRGIAFEIRFSHLLRDSYTRRNTLSNVATLLKFSGGKSIFVSSEAKTKLDMRSPIDITNLCLLFGMKPDKIKTYLSSVPVSVVLHGEVRKTVKTVLKVVRKIDPASVSNKKPRLNKTGDETIKSEEEQNQMEDTN